MGCKKNTCKSEFCGKAAKPANDKGEAPKSKCCAPKADAPKKGCGC